MQSNWPICHCQLKYRAAHVYVSHYGCALKESFYLNLYCQKKTNQQWFSMVCTLINNNIHYHSGQNFLWTHLAEHSESTTFGLPHGWHYKIHSEELFAKLQVSLEEYHHLENNDFSNRVNSITHHNTCFTTINKAGIYK